MKQVPVMPKDKSKSKKSKQDEKQKNNRNKETDDGWVLFCDFHMITHTVIKETTVTIMRQDNKKMVRQTHKHICEVLFTTRKQGFMYLCLISNKFPKVNLIQLLNSWKLKLV